MLDKEDLERLERLYEDYDKTHIDVIRAIPILIHMSKCMAETQRLWTEDTPRKDGFYWWRRDFFHPPAVVQVMGDTAYYLGEKRVVLTQGGMWIGPLAPPS